MPSGCSFRPQLTAAGCLQRPGHFTGVLPASSRSELRDDMVGQVRGYFILACIAVRVARERQTGQRTIGARGKQHQRVISPAPATPVSTPAADETHMRAPTVDGRGLVSSASHLAAAS